MKFSTTIKKKYWLMKMLDLKAKGHFWEYKQDSSHWNIRLNKLKVPCPGVFLVGGRHDGVCRVTVVDIQKFMTEHIPVKYAREMPTEQCWGLKCVAVDPGEDGEPWSMSVDEDEPVDEEEK